MTLIPNLRISGIAILILGSVVTIWAVAQIPSKNGSLVLILPSMTMLLVGGGLIPPAIGVVAGIIVPRVMRKNLRP